MDHEDEFCEKNPFVAPNVAKVWLTQNNVDMVKYVRERTVVKAKPEDEARVTERVALLLTPAERERLRVIEKREERGPSYLVKQAMKKMFPEIFEN
jgi:hypothetical protein